MIDYEKYRRQLLQAAAGRAKAERQLYSGNSSKTLLQELAGYGGFSYDPQRDPAYRALQTRRRQLGKAAMQDTLGQLSARTGGLASSYAQTAAQQAYDRQLQAADEDAASLAQQAYSRWSDGRKALLSQLEAQRSQEEQERKREREAAQYEAQATGNDRRLRALYGMEPADTPSTAGPAQSSGTRQGSAQRTAARHTVQKQGNSAIQDNTPRSGDVCLINGLGRVAPETAAQLLAQGRLTEAEIRPIRNRKGEITGYRRRWSLKNPEDASAGRIPLLN